MPSDSQKFTTLEFFRGVAALFVVLFHYQFYTTEYFGSPPSLARLFEGGHAGVEFFFVLSWFIIYYIHRQDIGRPGQIANFVEKRSIRIMPMYWTIITISCIAFLIHPSWGKEKDLTAAKVIMDYLLVPRDGQLILAPAWTLKQEMIFYVILATIISYSRIGIGLFCFWQASIVLANLVVFSGVWSYHQNAVYTSLLDIHDIGFGIGVICAWIATSTSVWRPRLSALLILLGSVIMFSMMSIELIEDKNFYELQSFVEQIAISALHHLVRDDNPGSGS